MHYCDGYRFSAGALRGITLCLVALQSAKLEYEPACDHVRDAGEYLRIKILLI